MIAIRQELRITMVRLLRLELRDDCRLATCGRNAKQRSGERTEKDRVVAVPGTAPLQLSVREHSHGTAVDIDALQLSVVCEESDRATVRSPEWKRRAIGACQRSRRGRIE